MIDPIILARSVHLAATLVAAGTVCFLALVAAPAAAATAATDTTGFLTLRRQLVWVVWAALALAILSGATWLALLAADIYGAPLLDVCLHGGAWTVLTDTRFGWVWSVRLALALSLAVLMVWRATWLPQLVAAIALVGLIALIGHAGATPGLSGRVHLANDMLHLLAAAVWVGGLPALALLLAQARREDDPTWREITVGAAQRFSGLATASVAALLASGIVNSWNLLGDPRNLIATDYGRLLLLKIGLFVAMLGIAAVNRFHFTPRLPGPHATRGLERNSLAETALGLCVLLFVGALGTLSPSNHVHGTNSPVPTGAAFAHIHSSEAMADVTIDPGSVGQANASIRLLREDFTEFPAKSVELTLDPPGAGTKIVRAAAHLPDGTWRVNAIALPQAGVWTVRVIVPTQSGPPIVLDAPIVIER